MVQAIVVLGVVGVLAVIAVTGVVDLFIGRLHQAENERWRS